MRQLKTPEEIIQEWMSKEDGEFPTCKEEIEEMIKAAQRDALECAAECAVIIFKLNPDLKTAERDSIELDKSSILNLMPKP